jgi:hypothetical protein
MIDFQADHVQGDVEEQQRREAVKEMRRELLEADHDCRMSDPDSACSICKRLMEAGDEEIINKYREVME